MPIKRILSPKEHKKKERKKQERINDLSNLNFMHLYSLITTFGSFSTFL